MKKMTKLYIVSGSSGEYSDRSEWNVCAFDAEADGQAFAVRCQQEVRSAAAIYQDRNPWDMEHDESEKLVAKLNATHPDPFISVSDYGARDASYYCGVLHVGRPPTRAEWERQTARWQAEREKTTA